MERAVTLCMSKVEKTNYELLTSRTSGCAPAMGDVEMGETQETYLNFTELPRY